jgi:RecB family exonuclease
VIPRHGSSRDSVEAEFERLLSKARSKLETSPDTAHFAELKATMSEVDWHNKTKGILLAAERLLDRSPARSTRASGSGPAPLDFEDLGDEGCFHEVNIRSGELRLAGRMDLVEISHPRRVVISDYKTGRVLNREGEVREHISLQLRLYALAVERLDPTAEVQLCVIEGTSNRQLQWDAETRAMTEAVLQSVLKVLPAGESYPAEELARPGPWCSSCSFRHVCPRYLASAPEVWSSGCEDGAYPLDTWGILRARQQSNTGVVLDLIDAAKRNVRIQRVDLRHGSLDDYVVGYPFHFFGLASIQQSLHQGKHFHPRNFFELPSDRTPFRAWSLTVFVG